MLAPVAWSGGAAVSLERRVSARPWLLTRVSSSERVRLGPALAASADGGLGSRAL